MPIIIAGPFFRLLRCIRRNRIKWFSCHDSSWLACLLVCFPQALHHPFTAPHPDDMGDLRTARALAYDMVYNGVEVGSEDV